MSKLIPLAAGTLSLASLDAQPFDIDPSEINSNSEVLEVVLPKITAAILDERWPDWRTEVPREDSTDWEAVAKDSGLLNSPRLAALEAEEEAGGDVDWKAIALDLGLAAEDDDLESEEDWAERAGEEWQDKDDRSFYEWKDGYWPMMNAVWPIALPYGADAEEIAGRIEQVAGCVSLVAFDEDSDDAPSGCPEHALALTGGGMDLSPQLAVAYVAAGVVPPLRMLRNLSWANGLDAVWREAIVEAAGQAAEFYQRIANDLPHDVARAMTKT